MPSRHASTRVEGAPPWMASRYADLRPGPLPKVEEKTRLIIVAREDLGKSTWHWSMEDMEECQVTMKKLHLRGLCPNTGAQPLMLMYIYIYICVCVCLLQLHYIYICIITWLGGMCLYQLHFMAHPLCVLRFFGLSALPQLSQTSSPPSCHKVMWRRWCGVDLLQPSEPKAALKQHFFRSPGHGSWSSHDKAQHGWSWMIHYEKNNISCCLNSPKWMI